MPYLSGQLINSNATVDGLCGVYVIDASQNGVTVTLPPALPNEGLTITFKRFSLKDNSSNRVIVQPFSSSENIDGDVNRMLDPLDTFTVNSFGGSWISIQ